MTEDTDSPSPYSPLKPLGSHSMAVAIKGEGGNAKSLPKIIASGRGKLAEQILEMAFAKGIKVRQDADLAELLTKLDLDTPIPSEAIIAVAEILARVYAANARLGEVNAADVKTGEAPLGEILPDPTLPETTI